MIEIVNVWKYFDEQPVLRGINLVVPSGKTTLILGRSGCGKSVLLKVILRLLDLDEGRIIINGVDTTDFDESQMMKIRKKIGMLFQSSALFDSLTVWENVAFPLVEHSTLSEEEINERVMTLLEFVELSDAANKLPGELSGGMKKRAALARALATNPEFLFFDEPTTGLDPITAARINELIIRTKERFKTTSIVVTHDIISALTVGDKFAFIHDGRIEFEGNREELLNSDVPALKEFLSQAAPKSVINKLIRG